MNWKNNIYICALVVTFTSITSGEEASYIIASHERDSRASTDFSAPAGQFNYAGTLYDVKWAQTFTATQSGFIQSVSLAAGRALYADTTAPLRVRITDASFGIPNTTLAEIYIAPSQVPMDFSWKPYINLTIDFTSTGLYLEEGSVYGLVFDSTEPEANYLIYGSDEYPYPDGTEFRLNNNIWEEYGSGDFFFQVRAVPPLSIHAFTVTTGNMVQLAWTNSVGETWVDQSTNLKDWDALAGPLTNSSSWAGTVEEANQRFFRIRY